MLISPSFYLRWFQKMDMVAGVVWLALALLSWLLFTQRPLRVFLLSLLGAYFVYGLVFDYHISSHDYYSLPLIPMLGLALAPLAADVLARLQEKMQASRLGLAVAIGVFVLTFGALGVERYLDLRTNDYRADQAFWVKMGEVLNHQPGVVAVTTDYGYPLEYYGWQNADPWTYNPDDKNINLTFALQAGRRSYFLVTNFDEYDGQPALKALLTRRYPILAQDTGYIVFDLLHPIKAVKK